MICFNTNRVDDCPFDVVSQKPGRCVYSDCCGIVEAIAVNKSNTAFAYAGMNNNNNKSFGKIGE